MVCYYPLQGWRSKERGTTGKRGIVFNVSDGLVDRPITLPCGNCTGCRLERSRRWAVRCMFEAQMHDENSYLTLTYRDEDLPEGGTLVKKHYQDFMKRLRSKYVGRNIRYFQCGEYGDDFKRPHYHACLFGLEFADKQFFRMSNGHPLYISQELQDIWGLGFCTIGDVTFESAAYVARYVMKKLNGERAEEYGDLEPEYCTMSLKPGIGFSFFDKFVSDLYPSDFVVVNGKKIRPPRYFDELFEKKFPNEFRKLKVKRTQDAAKHKDNNRSSRHRVREEVQKARTKMLARNLEEREDD